MVFGSGFWSHKMANHIAPNESPSVNAPPQVNAPEPKREMTLEELMQGVPVIVRQAEVRLGRDWKWLLIEHLDRWVAYTNDGLAASELTSKALTAKLAQLGINLDDCVLKRVVPWLTIDENTGVEVTTFWGVELQD